MAATVQMSNAYVEEMNKIKCDISQWPGYKQIASSLGKFVQNQSIVAGLIGCVIPESGTNHRILNAKEYNGRGVSGTAGWNCGEGLIQWTYWKYKLPLIKTYNADSRSTQKLPTEWSVYSQGSPHKEGPDLVATEDGKHIAGLSLDNQMLFFVLYYGGVIKSLANENNLAVIVAKIYQFKAGQGFFKNITDPVVKAYTTAKEKYHSSSGNHFLRSLKVAQQYLGCPVEPGEVAEGSYTSPAGDINYEYVENSVPNKVYKLASANKPRPNVLDGSSDRKSEFEALQNEMCNNTPEMGRDIILSGEMYDSNILKGSQESKKEKF